MFGRERKNTWRIVICIHCTLWHNRSRVESLLSLRRMNRDRALALHYIISNWACSSTFLGEKIFLSALKWIVLLTLGTCTYIYLPNLNYNTRAKEVIYQSRETVFHRDIETPRRELKIRCAAEYFWRNSRCLDSLWNTVSSVWYIFSIETNRKIWTEE